ncbi:LssY C-terminal domain-containing protein [Terrarubrum flagellatum]|uniref:LssY C-terminal domain-containing protein n=1 Tax=Terrirubrum flagellatum TaxID=2895980 RepID=UPI0031451685
MLAAYVLLAYLLLPFEWLRRERAADAILPPMVTQTAQGIPGDPLNIGVAGSQAELLEAMKAAGWSPADPVTLRSSLEIAGSVVLDRPYRDAPVSALFYEGKREALAFEKLEGSSADRRHHVRFWKLDKTGENDRPFWLGAVTFDRGVGFSRYTGQITHHIAPDIDAERDALVASLTAAGMVQKSCVMPGRGATQRALNGEGDPYFTDGEIRVVVLKVALPSR